VAGRQHQVGELEVVAEDATAAPEALADVVRPDLLHRAAAVGRERAGAAQHRPERSLCRPLPLEQQPVADLDQARQPARRCVGRPQVAGHRADARVAERRHDPADPVRRDAGVGVDRHHQLAAAFPQRGRLRLPLATVAVKQHHPPGTVGLRLQHREQICAVARPVVHHPDRQLALVVLPAQRAQAGGQQRRLLVVAGHDHVDARRTWAAARRRRGRTRLVGEASLQPGVGEREGEVE